jgi:phage head maturation protease
VGVDRWYQDSSGITVREIQRVSRLYDVSVVTDPAYPATTVSVRALDMARQFRAAQGSGPDEAARLAAQGSREILRRRLELLEAS